jgi:hypothetical protein
MEVARQSHTRAAPPPSKSTENLQVEFFESRGFKVHIRTLQYRRSIAILDEL